MNDFDVFIIIIIISSNPNVPLSSRIFSNEDWAMKSHQIFAYSF